MAVPTAPSILTAVNTLNVIQVSWSSVSGATSYTVSLSPSGGTSSETVSTTSVSFSGVTPNIEYTVNVFATNESGNSSTSSMTVNDLSRGLIWWIDVDDYDSLTISGTRTIGSTEYPVVSGIRDKSGSGDTSKNAVISTTGPNPASTGPIYISSLTTAVTQDSSLRTYAPAGAPNGISLFPTAGINKPSLLFRGKSNPSAPNGGYDSLQGTPGSSDANGTPMSFFAVCKQLGTASFFGSTDNQGTYINYDQWYGEFANGGRDAINASVNRITASRINQYNFVVEGVFRTPENNLAVNINGARTSTRTSPSHIGNFNNMRICGRTSGYTPSGYFNELLLYNRVLTETEVRMIEGYLAWKWNVTLNPSHPYTSTPYMGAVSTTGGSSSAANTVRNAPSLSNASPITLSSIDEDNTSSGGDTIASIITSLGESYIPHDVNDQKGIAINNIVSTNGSWQYTTNGGSTWTTISNLSGNTHFLLQSQTTNTKIRFVPNANFNGTATISFRAWDALTGTSGSTESVSSTGGNTSYSSETVTATIYINAANDAPMITGSYTFPSMYSTELESSIVSVETILSSYTLTDVDIENAQSVTALAIIGADTSLGTWYYSVDNKVSWNPLTSVSASSALHFNRTSDEFIKFLPSSGAFGTTYIQVRAWDKTNEGMITNRIGDASSGGESTAYSANTPTIQLVILQPPSVPQSPQISLNNNGIFMQWSAPESVGSSAVTSYKVYRVDNGEEVLENTVLGLSAQISSSLIAGTSYSFKISAINSAGEGPKTSQLTITYYPPPSSVTNLVVVSKNESIDVSWTASSSGTNSISSYKIYNLDTDQLMVTVAGNVTNTTITGLNNLLAYGVYVVATNDTNLTSVSAGAWSLPFLNANSTTETISNTLSTTLEGRTSPENVTASIITSVSASNNSEKTKIIKNVMNGTFRKLVSESAISSNLSSLTQVLKEVNTNLSESTIKNEVIKASVELIVEDAVLQSNVTQTRISNVKNAIKNAVTEFSANSVAGTDESVAKKATRATLQNTTLNISESLASLIVTAQEVSNIKNDIFEALVSEKQNEAITISGDALTLIRNSIDSSKRSADFNSISSLTVKVPSSTKTVDIGSLNTTVLPYVPMKSNEVYTFINGGESVSLSYNSTSGKLYNGATEISLGTNITIGTRIYKVIQVGSTTLQYVSTTGEGGGSSGGGQIPCIVKGQKILTPEGYIPVETLKHGDIIVTSEKKHVPVRVYSFTIEKTDEKTAPICISANSFGKANPPKDILLSPLHAIKKDTHTWEIPMHATKRYSTIYQLPLGESVTYYHIETPNYMNDHLVIEGATVESLGTNFLKKNGLEQVQLYTWSNRYRGYTRYKVPVSKKL